MVAVYSISMVLVILVNISDTLQEMTLVTSQQIEKLHRVFGKFKVYNFTEALHHLIPKGKLWNTILFTFADAVVEHKEAVRLERSEPEADVHSVVNLHHRVFELRLGYLQA